MTVRHEIKSQLAKLLATEDLMVEHKKVETACFNVHTRVLTLPMWEASSGVFDMLVGHEVGHALYTPDRNWLTEVKIPPQFVNVVEDVRIEKLMKRRYMGIAKTFYRGYQELSDKDFFDLDGEDISEFSLADRANLYFKIGNFIDVSFSQDEMKIINQIESCESFDDVLSAAEVLYNFCNRQDQVKTNIDNLDANQQSGGQEGTDMTPQNDQGDSSDEGEGNDFESEEPEEGESYGGTADKDQQQDNPADPPNTPPSGAGGVSDTVKTMDSLEQALKDLASMEGSENVYLEVPDLDIDKIVVPMNEIQETMNSSWDDYEDNIFEIPDGLYTKFKRSAQKEVNYLVKEFECRKSANSYARATTSRTGVLDCSKLHTYKYNEDLFKKVTTLADGKNHGLVFVLDWSGSMQYVMEDTIKQLYNLIWFCRKVNIPFDVYAFTSEYPRVSYDEDGKAIIKHDCYERKHGLLGIPEWFSLMNLFTSKCNAKELDFQMKRIYRLAYSFSHYATYRYPTGMGLSGTPLNEALMCLHKIIPNFKNQHKLQKVQCVILTDGEAAPLKYHREVQRPWDEDPYLGIGTIGPNAFLRDRKLGTTYSFDCEWYDFTKVLLKNLKDKFQDTNFIGMRVLESRDAGSFIRRYCGYFTPKVDKVMSVWKKNKAFSLTETGYDKYFGISATALANDAEFEVKEDATKSQIKSAFKKSLASKKMNKKILGEFVELIA